MVYGMRSGDGRWRAHSRISTHACIERPASLRLGDHVYIGHFSLLDASGGLEIGDGCQITSHVCILTHSSHRAIRLAREGGWDRPNPPGWVAGATRLGAWTFVGPHSVIAPGATLGRGALIQAFSYVRGEVPAFAVMSGRPARQVGDTRELDGRWIAEHPEALDPSDLRAWQHWVRDHGAGA